MGSDKIHVMEPLEKSKFSSLGEEVFREYIWLFIMLLTIFDDNHYQ